MKIKLDVSAVLAVALGCFASSASANVKYTPEYTNSWFSVAGDVLDDAAPAAGSQIGETGGYWAEVPAGGVTLGSEKLLIDTDVNSALVYTNATSVGKDVYRIEATIKVTLSTELPELSALANAKTALCVCTNGVEGAGAATNWWALVDGSWSNLGGSPVIDATYTVALDSDTSAQAIRYLAKTGDGEFEELTSGWVANSESGTAITKLAFAGSTELSYINGIGVVQGYAVEDGGVYASDAAAIADAKANNKDISVPVSTGGVVVASAKISDEFLIANSITRVDQLNANGENGVAKWQSYVLGLDPADTSSKPVVQPVQNAATDAIEFSMGNVAVNSDAGVAVKYRVNEYSDSSATTPSGTPGEFVDSSAPFTVGLPTDGVKYYKMEIQFGE